MNLGDGFLVGTYCVCVLEAEVVVWGKLMLDVLLGLGEDGTRVNQDHKWKSGYASLYRKENMDGLPERLG